MDLLGMFGANTMVEDVVEEVPDDGYTAVDLLRCVEVKVDGDAGGAVPLSGD